MAKIEIEHICPNYFCYITKYKRSALKSKNKIFDQTFLMQCYVFNERKLQYLP